MTFINNIKKVNLKRNHKIKNSYGLIDAYKDYKKSNKNSSLTLKLYSTVIKEVNKSLVKYFLQGNEIIFPKRLGSLYLTKNTTKLYNKDGKLKNTYPINWDATLKLWESDLESYNKRSLVKTITKEVYKVKYDKQKANYKNKSIFDFKVNRQFKLLLKDLIINNNIDAYIRLSYE